ncbi:hypothetical protein [Priestia flexa]|uniref:hypothetical protein n=1 Tax=Priestia flexa TaxID=86664 RepID=UPI000473BCB3|nr:hypothetical protein [Priestia flexa]
MKKTKSFAKLNKVGIKKYLEEHGERIENVGESLVEYKQTSVMLNCYTDEETGEFKPIYEFENEGHLTQCDTYDEAFNLFSQNARVI